MLLQTDDDPGIRGTIFVPGSGTHQRSAHIFQQQLAAVREGVLYQAWCCLRKPFLLPQGLSGHSCAAHWEKFDVDKAACKQCANVHLCNALHCESVVEREGVMCHVTGLFLGQRLLAQHENPYDQNAETKNTPTTFDDLLECTPMSPDGSKHRLKPHVSENDPQFSATTSSMQRSQRAPKRTPQEIAQTGGGQRDATERGATDRDATDRGATDRGATAGPAKKSLAKNKIALSSAYECSVTSVEFDNVLRTVSHILLSPKTQVSIQNETVKLMSKLRSVAMRRLRQYRVQKRTPNLCDLDAHLHHMLCGHRLPPPLLDISSEQRRRCAHEATRAISQLIHFMRKHCVSVPTCVKQGGVVAGMLYMMRFGVTIDSVTVLPCLPELKRLLPLEQHLPIFFNMRAKIVTEAENVIKYNMRGVSQRKLALLAQTHCITRSD